MLYLTILFFLSHLHSVKASSVPELSSLSTNYEVIVVGGGPSGLAALSSPGRIHRKALLIDSTQYRNAPTRLMHDVPGFDGWFLLFVLSSQVFFSNGSVGVTPAYYRWSAMQRISHYATVNATNGTVTSIQPESNYTFFTVSMTAFDDSTSKLTARKIILATGLRDILPETPGLKENQSMDILGPLDDAIEAAVEVTTLNSDIVIFANGTDTSEYRKKADKKIANSSEYLQRRHIKVDNRTLTRITRLQDGSAHQRGPSLPMVPEHDLFRVEFDDFGRVEREVLFTVFASKQRSTLGEDLGVTLVDGKMYIPDRINMRTNIPGIHAVGDIAVVDLQMELEREISRYLKPHSRMEDGDERNRGSLWAQMNESSVEAFNDL
ncbi:hypothetical protein F53441_246 [Fusarium austroafricanum]|uniref:FAD/NAD(P)-binding domain-containing protein n=1 Tax=Fusarium austroafricanum TaxID=2364996 RepID=A0A8H4P5C0_9HYPO|nr:hypothetical protein F53441_246 [Fusarium austroafricanum]